MKQQQYRKTLEKVIYVLSYSNTNIISNRREIIMVPTHTLGSEIQAIPSSRTHTLLCFVLLGHNIN